MTWFQIWTVCWQIAMFVTPIVVATSVLWLRSQFVTKSDAKSESIRIDARFQTNQVQSDQRYQTLHDDIVDHRSRLTAVEKDLAKPPSRHQLNNTIATMQAGLHQLGKSVDLLRAQLQEQSADLRRQMDSQNGDVRRQMETTNQYLHSIIEKHIA